MTTPRRHTGGATTSRPPGANSGCHGEADPCRGLGMSPNRVWHSKYTADSCSRNRLRLWMSGRPPQQRSVRQVRFVGDMRRGGRRSRRRSWSRWRVWDCRSIGRSSRGCPSPGPGLTEDYDRARPVRCRRLRARRVKAGGRFICGFLAGKPGMDHELLYDDGPCGVRSTGQWMAGRTCCRR